MNRVTIFFFALCFLTLTASDEEFFDSDPEYAAEDRCYAIQQCQKAIESDEKQGKSPNPLSVRFLRDLLNEQQKSIQRSQKHQLHPRYQLDCSTHQTNGDTV